VVNRYYSKLLNVTTQNPAKEFQNSIRLPPLSAGNFAGTVYKNVILVIAFTGIKNIYKNQGSCNGRNDLPWFFVTPGFINVIK